MNKHSKTLLASAAETDARKDFGASALLKSAALSSDERKATTEERASLDDLRERIAEAEEAGRFAEAGRLKSEMLRKVAAL